MRRQRGLSSKRFQRRAILRAGVGAGFAAAAALIGGQASAGPRAPWHAPSLPAATQTRTATRLAFNPQHSQFGEQVHPPSIALLSHGALGWTLHHPSVPGAERQELPMGPYVLTGAPDALDEFIERNEWIIEGEQAARLAEMPTSKMLRNAPQGWVLGTWTGSDPVSTDEFMQWRGATDVSARDPVAQAYYRPERIEPGQTLWAQLGRPYRDLPTRFHTGERYGPERWPADWQLLDPHEVVRRYLPVVFGESDEERESLTRIEKWDPANPPAWFIHDEPSSEDLDLVHDIFDQLRELTQLDIAQAGSEAEANYHLHLRVSGHFHHPAFDREFERRNLGRFYIAWDGRRRIYDAVVVVQDRNNQGDPLQEQTFQHLCLEEITQSLGLRNDPSLEREHPDSVFSPLWQHQPTELSLSNQATVWLHHRSAIRPNMTRQEVEDSIRREIGFFAQ